MGRFTFWSTLHYLLFIKKHCQRSSVPFQTSKQRDPASSTMRRDAAPAGTRPCFPSSLNNKVNFSIHFTRAEQRRITDGGHSKQTGSAKHSSVFCPSRVERWMHKENLCKWYFISMGSAMVSCRCCWAVKSQSTDRGVVSLCQLSAQVANTM